MEAAANEPAKPRSFEATLRSMGNGIISVRPHSAPFSDTHGTASTGRVSRSAHRGRETSAPTDPTSGIARARQCIVAMYSCLLEQDDIRSRPREYRGDCRRPRVSITRVDSEKASILPFRITYLRVRIGNPLGTNPVGQAWNDMVFALTSAIA